MPDALEQMLGGLNQHSPHKKLTQLNLSENQ
jgi:hypothetical protein